MERPVERATLLRRLREPSAWDLVVIGGGATGLGIALDAAARGYAVALVEADDFAKGTSSRATKLVHGGVRYLAQGNVALVHESLRERATLLANAPHVAQPLGFVMPSYSWWETPFYGAGLKAYDLLAGRRGLSSTRFLSPSAVLRLLPGVRPQGLSGGVEYWDGQFDDARLAVLLARTAYARGAVVVNHCPVTALVREGGKVQGVIVTDSETGERCTLHAKCVVNATGVWVDRILAMDRDPKAPPRAPLVAPSQGVHLVVDRAFLLGPERVAATEPAHALLVPKTADGRVLFAVPWLGKLILGTTDTPRDEIVDEPAPLAAEVDFILRESARYLARAPQRADVRSVWVGLRPLVRASAMEADNTQALSREHTVAIGHSGLVTVTGGKWTTYRAMAEDVLDQCFDRQLLQRRGGTSTEQLPLVGAQAGSAGTPLTEPPGEHLYGSEAAALHRLRGAGRWLWRDGAGGLTEAMVRFAVRHEFARTVEDVLARRSRLLFLDAKAAASIATDVAALMADELGEGFDAAASAASFAKLARRYATPP
jgi:glycerol-3-phosphate dehydrogenase